MEALKGIALKNNWELKLISDVVFFQEGPGVRKQQYTPRGVKLLNVTNILDGSLDLDSTDRYISEEEAYGKYKHFLVDEGDLLIACSGIQISYFDKKISFVTSEDLPLCMNTSTMRFKTKDKNKLNIKYFYYFLKSNYFKKQLARQITGSAQLNFGPSHIKKMYVVIPDIDYQIKIINILDRIINLIKIRKEQIQAYDDLIESLFYKFIRSDYIHGISFDDLFEIIDGDRGKNYPKKNDLLEKGYCLFLNAKNVTKYGFKFDELEFITEEKDKVLRKGRASCGDFILTTRGTVGNIAYIDEDINFKNIRINSGMVILRKKMELNPKFFEIVIRKTDILNKAMSGSAQPQLPIKSLKKVNVPMIDIKIQNKFADYVVKIEEEKKKLRVSLDELEIFFDGLMQDAFSGNLFKE